MESKYTKGEWEIDNNGSGMCRIQINPHDPIKATTICSLAGNGNSIEIKANAKLIAAAHDLLLSAMFDACFPITTMEEESKTQEFAIKLGWKKDMPLENFAVIVRENAIKKAIE